MYELSQDWTRCVAPNHGAWLAQSHAKTAHSSDLELASNESVQLDAPGDEIPAVLVGRGALPGRPEGKVPAPTTCRSPSRPSPGRARAAPSDRVGSPAAGATQIASSDPEAVGAAARGGSASAMSAAARRNPSSIDWFSIAGPPAGSHTTPDGTPYITTERRPSVLPAVTRAIHGPGHENEGGSASRTIPIPNPPSQRDTVHPLAGSSSSAGSGSASRGSSRIVARHARKDSVSRDRRE